jgi:hypothetical protein
VVLANHFLAILGRQLVKLLRELRVRRENGSAVGRLVNDMNNFAARVAVLLQQAGDGFAGGRGVGDFELAFGVFVLCVDDDEGAVAGGGGGGRGADDLAEGLDGHCLLMYGWWDVVRDMYRLQGLVKKYIYLSCFWKIPLCTPQYMP